MTNQPTSFWLDSNVLGTSCTAWSHKASLRDALAWHRGLLWID
jgi:hypothetical protein